jgi:hypothetical protein
MFGEMGEAPATFGIVEGPDVVLDQKRDDRRAVVFVLDDPEAVAEGERRDRQVDFDTTEVLLRALEELGALGRCLTFVRPTPEGLTRG